MIKRNPVLASMLACGALALAAGSASARTIAVDFDGTSIDTTGEVFAFQAHADNFGTMPFQLDFGSGATTYDFCFTNSGFVQFTAAGTGCGGVGTTPAGNFIAPYVATFTDGSNAIYGTGTIDTVGAINDGVGAADAIRFIWQDFGAVDPIFTEIMLIDRGGGNFDFDLRYGNANAGILDVPLGGQQGFTLGANTQPLSGAQLFSATDYYYTFVGGVCTSTNCTTTTPPTTVEAPSGSWLWSVGLAIAVVGAARRRRLGLAAH